MGIKGDICYIIPSTGERIPKKGTMISCDGFGLKAVFIHDETEEVSNGDHDD